MWCEQILRNLAAPPAPGQTVDWVDIQWNQCGRLLKTQSRAGHPLRVLLPPGQRLRHNDVIYEDASLIIAIHVQPSEVIIAKPPDPQKLAILALELGNLHLPTQIELHEIIFIEDGPAMAVLDSLQIPWIREQRRFEPTQIISAPSVEISPSLRVVLRSQKAD
jgi:urease accessory protein UreE